MLILNAIEEKKVETLCFNVQVKVFNIKLKDIQWWN